MSWVGLKTAHFKMEYKKKNTVATQDKVYYKLLDGEGKEVGKSGYGSNYAIQYQYDWSACFGSIFGYGLPKGTKKMIITHPLSSVPYSEKSIKRWIDTLNEVGFPCEYKGIKDDNVVFELKPKDMTSKGQFCSTMTLIRTLYENSSNIVPENYFKLMDENPKRDKFMALQEAHKMNTCHFNGGHQVTYPTNGGNVDRKTLFDRFKESNTTPFSVGMPSLNAAWKK